MRRKFELTPVVEWLETEGIRIQRAHYSNYIRPLFDILDDHPIPEEHAPCCQDCNDYPAFRFHDDNPSYLGWEPLEVFEWRNSLTVRISSEET